VKTNQVLQGIQLGSCLMQLKAKNLSDFLSLNMASFKAQEKLMCVR